jgi:chromosome segregation ATPase
MGGTDFFDEDLQNREATRRKVVAAEGGLGEGTTDLRRPVSDLNLTRLARHREGVETQVAASAQELDRLRMRQEELERERRELEALRKKQEDYERGRKEILNRLRQSLNSMEKEQLKTEQKLELLQQTRRSFQGMVAEIEVIREEEWPEDGVADELSKALVVVEECRMQYNKALARLETVMGENGVGDRAVPWLPGGEAGESVWPGFPYWLKVGLALSLPLLVVLIGLAAAYLVWVLRTP